jgi:uncharacterized membrane protein
MKSGRMAYIDWMRGLACLLMFQTHCYDSWLNSASRHTTFFKWSQILGTLPAPLFLFLAGVAFALVTDKLRQRGMAANQIAATTIRRGAEIFGLGLLLRVQEFLLGWGWAPWTDLLRVDILNTIGISMMLMGIVCRFSQSRWANVAWSAAVATAIAMATPPLWSTWAPSFLPWYLESYINGVHTFGQPQPWLFPIFPWAAFAFAGLAIGFLLFSDWARANVAWTTLAMGAAGVVFYKLGLWTDANSVRLYALQDFWHSSPNFLLARVGILLMILWLTYVWCRWGLGQVGFSPMVQLGQTSLLVYWVHIEFVYGRFSIMRKQAQTIGWASLGLAVIFMAMLLLSLGRTNWPKFRAAVDAWRQRRSRAQTAPLQS